MIHGNYRLKVTCDICKTTEQIMMGISRKTCQSDRRDSGWVKVQGRDVCPACKRKMRERGDRNG